MQHAPFEKLHREGLISDVSLDKINRNNSNQWFSIFWEFRTALYTGVLMLSAGLGTLIYKNIDTIGHQVILLLIASVSIGCLSYCNKEKLPFKVNKVQAPNAIFDYVLLLGVLTFLTFMGYLQFQYQVFGIHYGMATFIPMATLFYLAYYFDHIGILSMAITNLAVWMGVSATPKQLLEQLSFNDERLIFTYLLLGLILISTSYFSKRYDLKKHFSFTYDHFGIHITFLALLAGFFKYGYAYSLIWFVLLGIVTWFSFKIHYKSKSLYFVLLTLLYGYIGISGLIVRSLVLADSRSAFNVILLYFSASGIALVFLVIHLNKKLK
jgi:hypothetical protein